jgi:uncharacterized protein YndB with AHSA1/START domain
MPTLTLRQTIDRPAPQVFDAITDVESFPTWNPTTKAARKLTDGPAGNGTRFELMINGFGKTLQELQEFSPNKQVKLVPIDKRVAGGHRFQLTAKGKSTQLDHTLEMQPKGVFRLFGFMMGPMARKNLDKTAAALKAHIEARPANGGGATTSAPTTTPKAAK